MRQYLNACNKLMSDQDDDEEMWEEAQEYWIDLIEEEGAAKMVNLAIGSLNDLTPKDKDAMTYFAQVLLMQGYLQQSDDAFVRIENAVNNLQ